MSFRVLLITGPFSIVLGFDGGLMALNDRLKLRSMVVGRKGRQGVYRKRGSGDTGYGAGCRKIFGLRRAESRSL